MPDRPRPPDELRRAIAADLRPVRPLPSPARRAIVVAAWIPVGIFLVLALLGLRRDLPSLGWPMTLGPLALEVVLALVLVTLALAESVPARGTAHGATLAVVGLAAVAFLVQAALTRAASAGIAVPDPLTSHGLSCFALQLVVGVPAFVLVAILVVRSAPLRAARAGLLGGAGAGLLAEGIYHLHCPITDLRHVVIWHGAAVVILAMAGGVSGKVWENLQRKRMETRSRSSHQTG